MDFHPIARIFRLMDGSEYEALVAHIAEHGQQEPIWLFEGRVLDGRNRWRACEQLGLEPKTREWTGDDPEAFVIGENLIRRHLTKEERYDIIRRMRGNGYKLQEIADTVGVGVGTVHRAVAGQVFHMEKVKGADGKRYPMQYAPRKPAPAPHVSHNSGNNEWYTPPEYIAAAREVMGGIDLDPASSEIANRTVGAERFFTAEDNGLRHDWAGRVWMNPPYASHLIGQFADKLARHVRQGDVTQACVLVNNATETGWFNTILEIASCACFVRGRVRFIDEAGNPSGAPLQGQAVLYIGDNMAAFTRAFGRFGAVLYA